MGVNLEAASDMLPTTRALVAARSLRRRVFPRTRRAVIRTARDPDVPQQRGTVPAPQWSRTLKDSGRLLMWISEEWLRHLLAASYTRRGYVVVFDRHFFVDHHGTEELVRSAAPRTPVATAHSWMLEHAYPRPELVICLDAPADVLWQRKREDSVEWLEARRRQYLKLADDVPAFALVDVDRPVEEVHSDVLRVIRDHRRL
jgi:hypothetical protein